MGLRLLAWKACSLAPRPRSPYAWTPICSMTSGCCQRCCHDCSDGPITSQNPRGPQLQRGRTAQRRVQGPWVGRDRAAHELGRVRRPGTGDRKLEKDAEEQRGEGRYLWWSRSSTARVPYLLEKVDRSGRLTAWDDDSTLSVSSSACVSVFSVQLVMSGWILLED